MRKLSNFDDFRIRFITGLTRSSLFCFQLAAGAGSLAALGLWRVCEDAAIGRRRLSRSEDSDSALLVSPRPASPYSRIGAELFRNEFLAAMRP